MFAALGRSRPLAAGSGEYQRFSFLSAKEDGKQTLVINGADQLCKKKAPLSGAERLQCVVEEQKQKRRDRENPP